MDLGNGNKLNIVYILILRKSYTFNAEFWHLRLKYSKLALEWHTTSTTTILPKPLYQVKLSFKNLKQVKIITTAALKTIHSSAYFLPIIYQQEWKHNYNISMQGCSIYI